MTENKKFLVAITACALMIILGVGLVFWAMWNERQVTVIDIRLANASSMPIEFDNLPLTPGSSTSYEFRFTSYSSKKYDVSLDFVEDEEKKDYNTLKHFVRVKIEVDDEILCDDLLERVIDGNSIHFPVDVGKKINTRMKVTYSLPEDIGNEAKGATAAFKLFVTAGNEDPEWDWD